MEITYNLLNVGITVRVPSSMNAISLYCNSLKKRKTSFCHITFYKEKGEIKKYHLEHSSQSKKHERNVLTVKSMSLNPWAWSSKSCRFGCFVTPYSKHKTAKLKANLSIQSCTYEIYNTYKVVKAVSPWNAVSGITVIRLL